jgi:hypothetical protein
VRALSDAEIKSIDADNKRDKRPKLDAEGRKRIHAKHHGQAVTKRAGELAEEKMNAFFNRMGEAFARFPEFETVEEKADE